MPANVQTMGYVGQVPWHGLGVKIRDQGLATSAEMVEAAGLDWQVAVMETETFFWEPDPSGAMVMNDKGEITPALVKHYLPNSTKSLVRLDNLAVLDEGVRKFTPYQNAQMFEWVDAIVGTDQAVYHTAGALGAGETVWVLVELPGEMYIGPKRDAHQKYVLIANSHQVGRALRIALTDVRVVCQNTLALALSGSDLRNIVSISHMPNIAKRAELAKDALGLINKRYNQIEAVFNELVRVQLDRRTLLQGLEAAWVMPSAEAESAGAEARRVQIGRLRDQTEHFFVQGVGQEMYPGSAYNYVNAVAEAATHLNGKRSPYRHFEHATLGEGAAAEARALAFAKTLLS